MSIEFDIKGDAPKEKRHGKWYGGYSGSARLKCDTCETASLSVFSGGNTREALERWLETGLNRFITTGEWARTAKGHQCSRCLKKR